MRWEQLSQHDCFRGGNRDGHLQHRFVSYHQAIMSHPNSKYHMEGYIASRSLDKRCSYTNLGTKTFSQATTTKGEEDLEVD